MKHFSNYFSAAIFILVAIVSPTAFAADPTDLEGVMKAIEQEVKVISQQVGDAQANADSANRSLLVRKLFVMAFAFEPPSLKDKPEGEKATLLRAYDRFLGRIIAVSADLEEDFVVGDNAKAKVALADMLAIRREAHKILK